MENNPRDRVHERHVNFNRLCDKVLYFTEHGKVILGFDVIRIGSVETSDKTAQRRNSNTFTNSQNRCGN